MNKRIGFACKWIDFPNQVDGIKPKDDCKKYNTGSTTVAWLNRQSKDVACEKLWSLMAQNIAACHILVERVGALDENIRMVRLSSDILPVYTEPTWSWFWRRPDVRAYCEKHFSRLGHVARSRDVRLSFHPGQFTVLASDNPDIVDRSIEEFEYHVDMARWMGYGETFQDFKINVHIAGRLGPDGIRYALARMTPEARNMLTIENDEITWGIDASLELVKDCALVLDIHHHFIKTGEYIQPADDRFDRIVDSWRGVRPVIHYSYSRNEHLPEGFPHDEFPNLEKLLESGHKKSRLRAHSDFYPNEKVNAWALSFLETADIMAESKGKNLASFALYEQYKSITESSACDRELMIS
jgi:UV DNA damage repair endonuclease